MNFLRKLMLAVMLVPLALDYFGAALNQVVIIANNGTFPVLLNDKELAYYAHRKGSTVLKDGMLDEIHCVMTQSTHLNMLADVFKLDGTLSIGDLFIFAGEKLEYASLYCVVVLLCIRRRDIKNG